MESNDERRGANPLSAFHTTSIVSTDEQQNDSELEQPTIGITPLHSTAALEAEALTLVESTSSEGEESRSRPLSPHDAILAPEEDVLQLLMHDERADPPIAAPQHVLRKPSASAAAWNHSRDYDDDGSSNEYHSADDGSDDEQEACQDQRLPSSPYDYDVNWDMVGQLRRPDSADCMTDEAADNPNNTSTCSSLAEAAAASMIATTAAEKPESNPGKPQGTTVKRSMFSRTARRTPHPANPYSYKYQKHDVQAEDDNDADDERGYQENETEAAAIPPDAFASAPCPPPFDAASEMNESTNTASNSSSSGSVTHRRRSVPLSSRKRVPRTSSSAANRTRSGMRTRRSASLGRDSSVPSPGMAPTPEDPGSASGLRTSLDSGMAAVRRWVRLRTTMNPVTGVPRSSHAARRWQREYADTSTLALGEEDLFALSNAGSDPRSRYLHSDEGSSHPTAYRSGSFYPPSILEEEEEDRPVRSPRQRAASEPDQRRIRSFFSQGPGRFRRRQTMSRDSDENGGEPPMAVTTAGTGSPSSIPAHLSSAALNSSLFHSTQQAIEFAADTSASERGMDVDMSSIAETATAPNASADATRFPEAEAEGDPYREARMRWIRINRRFQLVITIVALVFSLLLFAVLLCWVVLTSSYVISFDKPCDVPLKVYYWAATIQLIIDVLRNDIMRCCFRWDTSSSQPIPAAVFVYNVCYLIFALLVLRLGFISVWLQDEETCSQTAPALFYSSTIFVCLSVAAWSTIVFGYLVPFCFVAVLLTFNGYSPASDRNSDSDGAAFPGVFPAVYSNNRAPSHCIDQLRTVLLEEFPEEYPTECCICMGDFVTGEAIVATECQHVTHKRCLQEWLTQARTCPVCRADIPSSLPDGGGSSSRPANPLQRAFSRDAFNTEVVNIINVLRRREGLMRQRNTNRTASGSGSDSSEDDRDTEAASIHAGTTVEMEMATVEEGHGVLRQHSG